MYWWQYKCCNIETKSDIRLRIIEGQKQKQPHWGVEFEMSI